MKSDEIASSLTLLAMTSEKLVAGSLCPR
jgi:hypothetical protein